MSSLSYLRVEHFDTQRRNNRIAAQIFAKRKPPKKIHEVSARGMNRPWQEIPTKEDYETFEAYDFPWISPQEFYAYWNVSLKQMAYLLGYEDKSVISKWNVTGESIQVVNPPAYVYLRLGIVHQLWLARRAQQHENVAGLAEYEITKAS